MAKDTAQGQFYVNCKAYGIAQGFRTICEGYRLNGLKRRRRAEKAAGVLLSHSLSSHPSHQFYFVGYTTKSIRRLPVLL